MKSIKKQDFILEAIIQEYIKSKLPIGSSELQMKMTMEMSPSTIRIYFKKLSQEGHLAQLHVSSGRIPTYGALVDYWRENLNPFESLEIGNVDRISDCAKDFGIFCTLEKSCKPMFNEIVSVDGRFLILVFDGYEVVLKYNEKIKAFLSGLVGCSMKDLKRICSQVGLYELHDKLEDIFAQSHVVREGENEVYAIARDFKDARFVDKLLNSEFCESLEDGVYFDGFMPKGCMAIKHRARFRDDDMKLFCFGRIESDFKSFLNKAKE
ncbi:MAG: HrcA family transcriptional regulator [Sulfurospirillaceae bacterium]|nr:HrcA family transcriptional regulator [Sulfurospirillaceae bacterium]MDD3462939.1 HrcA family transcriptional regulator [Sulfurospirillaceae bacterium]